MSLFAMPLALATGLLLLGCSTSDTNPGAPTAPAEDAAAETASEGDGPLPGMDADPDAPGLDAAEAAVDASQGYLCDPPAPPGSFYELFADSLDRPDPVSMCEFRGKVVLIANVAAKCGFTPQLGVLATVQETYRNQGLVVLGFYSDQFGHQAGTPQEQETCETNYGVNFEVFQKINVNPPDEHPIFTWIKAQPGGAGTLKWNFEKFLISRKGEFKQRWPSQVEPDSAQVTSAIESALAETP